MFEKKIIEFLKENPEATIKLLKKNPNFAKYKAIYEHHYKAPKTFKSACISLEMYLDSHIEELIYSSLTRDTEALKSEGVLLHYELQDLKLLN